MFEYRLSYTMSSNDTVVTVTNLNTNETCPLPSFYSANFDQFKTIKTTYNWGYEGDGPKLLAKSILAYHLGHSRFTTHEVEYLVHILGLIPCADEMKNSKIKFYSFNSENLDKCLNSDTNLISLQIRVVTTSNEQSDSFTLAHVKQSR